MKIFALIVIITTGILLLLFFLLIGFMAFCRWRLKKIEEKMDRESPGMLANLKAAKACEEFSRRLGEGK